MAIAMAYVRKQSRGHLAALMHEMPLLLHLDVIQPPGTQAEAFLERLGGDIYDAVCIVDGP